MADVSEPTVNRFSRRLDTKGFPDFKLHLAQSLANGTPYVNRNVEEDDGPDAYTHKIFKSTMACLDVAKTVWIQCKSTVLLTCSLNQNVFRFGLGASSANARDAQNKFIRFNIPISCFEDIVMQRMSCINCTDNDVIVLIFHTGRTKCFVEIANLARENRSTVITIIAKDSPLDKASSLSICLDGPEDTDVYMPMASRVVQMTVIDVLSTGFTLRRGSGFIENLKFVKEVLKDSRYDKLPPY